MAVLFSLSKAFSPHDVAGTGIIPEETLFSVLRGLGFASDDKIRAILEGSGAGQSGGVDYMAMLRWIFPDSDDFAQYCKEHQLRQVLDEALDAVAKSKPVCPLEFLSNFFGTKADEKEPEGLHHLEAEAKTWRRATMADVELREKAATPRGEYKVLMVDVNSAALHPLMRCGQVDIMKKMTESQLCARIGDYDALVCRSSVTVTPKVVEAALPRLKVVALSQVGMDNVPIPLCAERGIRVCNSPVGNTVTTAEHTIALIFASVRKLTSADASMKAGTWDRAPFMGNQLSGNVLGLLGLGNIAFHVAKGAHAMGMRIVAYDPYAPQEKADSINATLYRNIEDLPKLLAESLVLSLHVPLTSETKGLINAERLAMMPKGAYIVNCARGGIVDEEALSAALHSGHLGGAATDVFATEKDFVDDGVPRDFCLATAPNTTLTPHLGAMTVEAQEAVAIDAAIQVEEFLLKGTEPKYGIVKADPNNPGKFVDGRPAWMK